MDEKLWKVLRQYMLFGNCNREEYNSLSTEQKDELKKVLEQEFKGPLLTYNSDTGTWQTPSAFKKYQDEFDEERSIQRFENELKRGPFE